MFEHLDQLQHVGSAFQALNSEGALTDGMQGNVAGDDLMNPIGESQTGESGCRQDQAVVVASIEFLQARDHIAAHIFELKVRVVVAQLGQPAQRAGAYHGAFRQGLQLVAGILGIHHEGVRRIFPFGDATQHQAFGKVGGQILEGVNGDLGPPHQHLGLEFLGEQALVADFGQGHIQNLVALGGHRFHRNGQARMGLFQFSLHPVGLHHGQLAAAGGDAQMLEGHGLGIAAAQTTQSNDHPLEAAARFTIRDS